MTDLCKFLRHLRVDRGERLKDMASKLGCSPSFLSGVENGHKNMSIKMAQKLVDVYKLDAEKSLEFWESYSLTRWGMFCYQKEGEPIKVRRTYE